MIHPRLTAKVEEIPPAATTGVETEAATMADAWAMSRLLFGCMDLDGRSGVVRSLMEDGARPRPRACVEANSNLGP